MPKTQASSPEPAHQPMRDSPDIHGLGLCNGPPAGPAKWWKIKPRNGGADNEGQGRAMWPTWCYPRNPPVNQPSSQVTATSWTDGSKGRGKEGRMGAGAVEQERLRRRYLASGCPKKRHFKNLKPFTHQEDTITVNGHAPKSTASKHMKRKMTTGRKNRQMHKYVRRRQSSLPRTETRAQTLSKEPQPTRTSHNVPPGTVQHTLFSSTDRTFSKTEHIPRTLINTSKLKNENYTN